MKKKNEISTLNSFLSLFNLMLKENDYYKINKQLNLGELLDVVDKEGTCYGMVKKNEDLIYIDIFLDNCEMSARARKNDKGGYLYKYTIASCNSNLKLNGSFEVFNGDKLKGIIKNKYSIYEGKKLTNKGSFYTNHNSFGFFDVLNNESIDYESCFLRHSKGKYKTNIEYNFENMFYLYYEEDSETKKKLARTGGYYLPRCTKDITYVEEELNKVIQEIDPEYFELIRKQQDLVDSFCPNLFYSMLKTSLWFLNKSQKKNLFGIGLSKEIDYSKKLDS